MKNTFFKTIFMAFAFAMNEVAGMPLTGAVNCSDCTEGDAIPKQDECALRTMKGGFRGVLQVSCKVKLNSGNIGDFLGGATVGVEVPDPADPKQNIIEQKTFQEVIDLGYAARLMSSVIGGLNASDKIKQKLDSCNTEIIDTITWAWQLQTKMFDTTGNYADCEIWKDFARNWQRRHLIMVSCQSNGSHLLQSGGWSLSDFDYVIPTDGTKEIRMRSFTAEKVMAVSSGSPCETSFPIYNDLTGLGLSQ